MSDLFGAAYRGDPSIPHVSEDFFKVVLVSANVRAMQLLTIAMVAYLSSWRHGQRHGTTTGCTLVREHARTHFRV